MRAIIMFSTGNLTYFSAIKITIENYRGSLNFTLAKKILNVWTSRYFKYIFVNSKEGGGQRVRQVEPCTFHLLKTNSWSGKRSKVLLKMYSQLVEIEFSPNFSLGCVRQADQVYTRIWHDDNDDCDLREPKRMYLF